MPRFTDCLGREWSLRLTLADLKPLKELGLDCAQIVTAVENLPDILFGDVGRLAAGVFRLAKPGISEEEFAEGIDGPTAEAMGVALIEAIVDFFPRSRIAQAMKGKVREALTALDEQLSLMISNVSVGNSPGSPSVAPTPAA